jgi:protein FAM32A
MSDYAHVPGGSLKFKGTGEKYVLPELLIVSRLMARKKKKKSHSTSERTRVGSEVRQSEKKEKGKARDDREDSNEIIVKTVAPGEGRKMTESERKFEEVQRLRVSNLLSTLRPD